MKKFFLMLTILVSANYGYAQFKVNSYGNASIGSTNPSTHTKLNVYSNLSDSSYVGGSICGIRQEMTIGAGNNCTGISGSANGILGQPTSCWAKGVQGSAGNGCSGYNYGVLGVVYSLNGTGIFGSGNGDTSAYLAKRYAGYFKGDVSVTDTFVVNGRSYFNNTLTAYDIVTPSDINLKDNIRLLADEETEKTALSNLLEMNVITYNYKEKMFKKGGEKVQKMNEKGEIVTAVEEDIISGTDSKQRHFGLSAQELQQVYPDLVRTNQDGTLGVNYVELVPILIRSIQELKQELDAVKGGSEYKTRSIGDETADFNAVATGNVLYQNTPNPFKEQTTIRFRLADDAANAAICIFDMSGKMLKKLPVSLGMTSVTINGYELGEGLYLYSLMVNGREIDTKRMILSK